MTSLCAGVKCDAGMTFKHSIFFSNNPEVYEEKMNGLFSDGTRCPTNFWGWSTKMSSLWPSIWVIMLVDICVSDGSSCAV